MAGTESHSETNRVGYAFTTGVVALALAVLGSLVFVPELPLIRLAADTTMVYFVLLTFYLSISVSLVGYRLLVDERPGLTPLEKRAEREVRKDFVSRISVSFAVAWLLAVICQAIFAFVIDRLFVDVELPRIVMMAVFALYGGVLGFGVAYFIVWVDDVEFNWLIIMLGVGGLLFSVTLVANPDWWQRSVSALGIDQGSGTFFNVTVIVTGLVALTLGRELIADLKLLKEAKLFPSFGFDVIRVGLTGIGLGITGVGLFPTEGLSFSHDMHLVSAYGLSILCIVGMLTLHRIAPNIYPQQFINVSRALGVICILVVLAHFAGPLGFVAMELILFAIFGGWVFYFRYHTMQYVRQQAVIQAAAASASAS